MNVEKEKKYVLKKGTDKTAKEMFKAIIKRFGLTKPKETRNIDVYYDKNNILDAYGINIRKRFSKGEELYTVKRPTKETDITERREENFKTLEEALEFAIKEWNIPIKDVSELLDINTKRRKYQLEIDKNIIEVCFDLFTPRVGICEFDEKEMIEFELKKGDTKVFNQISEIMQEYPYIEECHQSKKDIALKVIRSKTKINPFRNSSQPNNDEIQEFFVGRDERLAKLKDLDKKKKEINGIREKMGPLTKPLVVTLSGTPRAGKTTTIESLYEFFKKTGINTKRLEEPAGLIYATLKNREEKQKLLEDRVGFVDKQYAIGTDYINNNLNGSDLILCDRGAIDPFIWYDMYYQLGMVSREKYLEFLNKMRDPKNYINYFYGLYADEKEAMKRDYLSSISIEERTTMSTDNVVRYNASLLRILPQIEDFTDQSQVIDTSSLEIMESSIQIADEVLDTIKKLYLER